MWRAAAMLAMAAALNACGDRRTFDDRYANTASQIEGRARTIDAQLNAAQNGRDRTAAR